MGKTSKGCHRKSVHQTLSKRSEQQLAVAKLQLSFLKWPSRTHINRNARSGCLINAGKILGCHCRLGRPSRQSAPNLQQSGSASKLLAVGQRRTSNVLLRRTESFNAKAVLLRPLSACTVSQAHNSPANAPDSVQILLSSRLMLGNPSSRLLIRLRIAIRPVNLPRDCPVPSHRPARRAAA